MLSWTVRLTLMTVPRRMIGSSYLPTLELPAAEKKRVMTASLCALTAHQQALVQGFPREHEAKYARPIVSISV